jgi:hypothetical protein
MYEYAKQPWAECSLTFLNQTSNVASRIGMNGTGF